MTSNMQPKVSIVVPVYNVEKYLDRCVQSLRNQTVHDIEIILVDDESPDNCPALCDRYALEDARIKVVHKKNGGLGMACNSGIEAAGGEFIAFVDSDDWVDNNMYECMLAAAEKHNADVVYTGLKRSDGANITCYLPHPNTEEIRSDHESIDELFKDMIASAPQVRVDRRIQVSAKVAIYRKSVIDSNNIRFESERNFISEDMLFNLDFLRHAMVAVVLPEYFYYYYNNPNSITTHMVKDVRQDVERYHTHLISRYRDFADDADFRNRADRWFIGAVRSYMDYIVKNTAIGRKEKTRMIGDLCRCPNWDLVRKRYPIKMMPMVHRIVLTFTLQSQAKCLYLLLKLKNRK